MVLVKLIYEATQGFPVEERFGLSQQMRRAAVSVPSNIAEGAARNGKREFANFIGIARGSLSELDTQCLIAVELGYFAQDHVVFSSLDRVSNCSLVFTGILPQVQHSIENKCGNSPFCLP